MKWLKALAPRRQIRRAVRRTVWKAIDPRTLDNPPPKQ